MNVVFLSPLPLNLLSEMAQHLTKLNLAELISALPLHLMFIRHAATHPQINPVVSKHECMQVYSLICGFRNTTVFLIHYSIPD